MKKKLLSITSPKAKMLKKCVAVMTGMLLFFSIGVGLEAYAAETAAIPSGSVFTLRSESGKYLNVYNGNNANGVNVIQWDQDGSIEQKFRFVYDADEDAYRIYAMCSSNGTNRVLDVYRNNGLVDGCNVDIWTPDDDPAQLWKIQYSSQGYYYIRLKSNTNLALTAVGSSNGTATGQGSSAPGNVCVRTYGGLYQQRWYLEEVTPAATIADGIYNIKNNYSNLYLDAANGGTTAGTNVIQYTANNAYNQMWIVRHYQNGLYTIHPSYDDQLALAVYLQEDTLVTNGINVELAQMPSNQVPGAHMLWRIIQNANGTYRIVASGSYLHKVLVVQDASTSSNANVIQYQYNASLNDQWIFSPVSSSSAPKALLTIFSDSSGTSSSGVGYGHSFLSVKNISSANIVVGKMTVSPKEEITIGLWPKTNHILTWYNIEAYAANTPNGYQDRLSLTVPIDSYQLQTLNIMANNTTPWLPNHTCASFAIEIWNQVCTSEVDFADTTFPSILSYMIELNPKHRALRPIQNNTRCGYYKNDGSFVPVEASSVY